MNRIVLQILTSAFLCAYIFSSCNLVADTECGDAMNPNELVGPNWNFTSNSGSLPGEVYTYLENDYRYFVIRMYVEDLCTAVHTDVDYEVSLTGVHSLPLDIAGTTSWNFLYEEESVLSQNAIPPHTPVTASQDVGLFQAFGEDPGWMIMRLSLSFPTTNSVSFASDSAYFVDHVNQMNIYVEGYRPKN